MKEWDHLSIVQRVPLLLLDQTQPHQSQSVPVALRLPMKNYPRSKSTLQNNNHNRLLEQKDKTLNSISIIKQYNNECKQSCSVSCYMRSCKNLQNQMFSCCCPKDQEDDNSPKKNLKETLVSHESKNYNTLQNQSLLTAPSHLFQITERKENLVNKNLEQMRQYPSSNLNKNPQINKSNSAEECVDDVPSLELKSQSKSAIKIGSFEQSEGKRKGQLWLEEPGTKILYFIDQKQEQMILAYKIVTSKTNEQDILHYALNPSKQNLKIREKPSQSELYFIIFNKTASEVRESLSIMHPQRIYGAIKDDRKSGKTYYENDQIGQIIVIGCNCIRLEVFDSIVISCLTEKDFQQVLQFCIRITQFYQLDDLLKVIFVFPAYLSLTDINQILARLLRKFFISEKLQNILKYLGYHLELVENEKSDAAIFVRNSLSRCQGDQVIGKQFQMRVQLAIGVLMVEMTHSNFKAYEKLLDGFFADMNIYKYLRLLQFIHHDNKDPFVKIQELKIFDPSHIMELQNSSKIEHKNPSQNHKCILIRHRIKKRIGELFTAYRTSQTPLQDQNGKKQWDDDLNQNDIRVPQIEKLDHDSSIDQNCNIFQAIEESQIDNASLDIIASLDIRQTD